MIRLGLLILSIIIVVHAVEKDTPPPIPSLKTIVLENVQVGVQELDQKLTKVSHPDKIAKVLVADHHQKLILKFSIKDKSSGENVKVHQSFVRLALNDAEIIFVAERDKSGTYKFDLDIGAKIEEFNSQSGTYAMSVIIGDSAISNPINWYLADVKFEFPAMEKPSSEAWDKPKPEITHMFREPEKRPATVVSTAFTALCLVPLAGLILAWIKLGANISLFPFGLSSIFFHLGLGSIFILYFCFWLQLNMFVSMKYLIMIGVVTFLCGNSLLTKLAEKRKNAT